MLVAEDVSILSVIRARAPLLISLEVFVRNPSYQSFKFKFNGIHLTQSFKFKFNRNPSYQSFKFKFIRNPSYQSFKFKFTRNPSYQSFKFKFNVALRPQRP